MPTNRKPAAPNGAHHGCAANPVPSPSPRRATSASLGTIPAHLDPTVGGRLRRPGALARRLFSALHTMPGGPPPSFSQRDLTRQRVGDFAVATVDGRRSALDRLVDAGCVRRLGRNSRGEHRYEVVGLPAVEVIVDTSVEGVRRLIAWMALEARREAREGTRDGSRLTAGEVWSLLEGHGVSRQGSKANIVSHAIRSLGLCAPHHWLLDAEPLSGRLSIEARDPDGSAGTKDPVGSDLPRTRFWKLLAERLSDADPAIICVSDISTETLARVFPDEADPRAAARAALASFCNRSTRGSRTALVVDLGVVMHRRYVTLPTRRAAGRAAVDLLRAELLLRGCGDEIRALKRCPIPGVRDDRVRALTHRLAELRRVLERTGDPSLESPWLEREASRLVRSLQRHERAFERNVAMQCLAIGPDPSDAQESESGVPGASWSDVGEEAKAAIERWGARHVARLLAHRVRSESATLFDAPHRPGDRERLGAGRTYSAFEIRARLLSRVGDVGTRHFARHALRSLGPVPCTSSLIAGLNDGSVHARLVAAIGLALAGGAAAVALLEHHARMDPERGVREVALWGLTLLAPTRAAEVVASGVLPAEWAGADRVGGWVALGCQRGPVRWAA